jgi:uncharacterized protein YggE
MMERFITNQEVSMKSRLNSIPFNLLAMIILLAALLVPGLIPEIASRGVNPAAAAGTENSCQTERTVQVSGTAVVNVTPDRVLIQLGVQSNGRTPQAVEAANSATINRVIRALKKIGVEEKDIVTDRFVIDPIYKDYDSLTINGYRINNLVGVTLREIDLVNEVIIEALESGANQVVNVEFYLSDLRKYRDQARDLAVKAAGEKARDLADAVGAETGCVISINENTWSYFNGGWWGRSSNLWTQNTVQNIPQGSESGQLNEVGPLNIGQISVRAEVSAVYALES